MPERLATQAAQAGSLALAQLSWWLATPDDGTLFGDTVLCVPSTEGIEAQVTNPWRMTTQVVSHPLRLIQEGEDCR